MKNQYYFIRHGYSWKNKKKIASCWPEKKPCPLTEKGRKEAKLVAKRLKNKKIDLIFSSDLLRTRQTAKIIGKAIGLKVGLAKKLRETNVGIFNGQLIDNIGRFWDKERKLSPLNYYQRRFKVAPPKGETYTEIEKRMISFVKEMEKKYQAKNILIVSHQRPLTLLEKAWYNYSPKRFVKIIIDKKEIKTGEVRKLANKKHGP